MNFLKELSLPFITCSMVLIAGCSSLSPYKTPITQGTIINLEAVDTLQTGLTMEQVKQILGPPFGKDSFSPSHWEYVFYTTDESFQPGTIKHLIVTFDQENYLQNWKIIQKKLPANL
jgi:outer membrane protein assembly factor BamE